MTYAHWTLRLLAASALSICGCGGSPSAGKSYDHFVAAAKALETGDKETALTELSATLDTTPSLAVTRKPRPMCKKVSS
jgi:hypothetical protein